MSSSLTQLNKLSLVCPRELVSSQSVECEAFYFELLSKGLGEEEAVPSPLSYIFFFKREKNKELRDCLLSLCKSKGAKGVKKVQKR